jgi:very-short-patch-repair endonuclease
VSKKIITEQALALYNALIEHGVEAELEYWDGHKHIDICIPSSKIYIEVDGIQHLTSPDQIARDFIRDHYSDVDGFNTLHIPNTVVDTDLDKVVRAIMKVVARQVVDEKT